MKKSLIALATLAATGAFAQSTVEMYGRLDAGYNQTKISTTTAGVTNAVTTTNLVQQDNLNTGLLGIRGSEDLGGGMKAKFVHEMDLDINAGTLGTALGRDSTIGLEGGFGEVRLGRSYTPLFSVVGLSDPFATTGATTVNLYPDAVRASNAVFYTTPSFSGFTARLMVADGVVKTQTGNATDSVKAGQQGFYGMYANGPLTVAFGYGVINADASTNIAGKAKTNGNAFSGTYDLGVAKIFAGYTTSKVNANTAINTYAKQTEMNLGVSVPMGAVTLLGSVGRNTFQDVVASVGAPKETGNDFVIGATYALSKRTTAYAKMGTYNKFSVANSSEKQTTTALGMRHTF